MVISIVETPIFLFSWHSKFSWCFFLSIVLYIWKF